MRSKLLLLFILVAAMSTWAFAQGRHGRIGSGIGAGAHMGYGQSMDNGGHMGQWDGMGQMGNWLQIGPRGPMGQAGSSRMTQGRHKNNNNWGRGTSNRGQNWNTRGSGGTQGQRGNDPKR